jgi:hypothetical protein
VRPIIALFIFLAIFFVNVFTALLMHHAKAPEWLTDGFTSGVLGVAITFLVVQVRRSPKS